MFTSLFQVKFSAVSYGGRAQIGGTFSPLINIWGIFASTGFGPWVVWFSARQEALERIREDPLSDHQLRDFDD
jgi:hypothetical protein